MKRRRRDEAAVVAIATTVHRLAVLLAAGIAPGSAWVHLAQAGGRETPQVVRSVATDDGDRPIPERILEASRQLPDREREAWLALATAWNVATEAGAALSGCLRDQARRLRDLGTLQRDLAVALAGPRATARLVTGLPLVAVAFGMLLGFDSFHTLFFTVPGWVCLGGGAFLLTAGAKWSTRLVRNAGTEEVAPGLTLDLMAIAMSGGASVDRARAIVESALERCAPTVGHTGEEIDSALRLSTQAGVPAAELLRAEADQARETARAAGQERAASLAVTLMLPLGACVMPAFLLLGVAPLLISVVTATVTGFS